MGADPLDKAQTIFQQAVELSNAERERFLDDACGDDEALRQQVEILLQADADAGSFLNRPPDELGAALGTSGRATEVKPAEEQPGATIDRYKILQRLGEGGFGVVYMAEQTEPVKRRVALKIIKLGMDTKQVIARFEAERQALALMDHPNIAKVLDAGATSTGRPYFVMELVKGVPITDYCDGENLTTKARLQLFMDVCHAVQHAHQKGIIHRDIKPRNVMVTLHDGKPVPKVIDFGIAKATSAELTERTLFTEYGQFIGTPEYMSPEQAEFSGLDIDTRSDIYSLGVLLYELLTGTRPFDITDLRQAGLVEIQRIIREETPPKPSTRLSDLAHTFPSPSDTGPGSEGAPDGQSSIHHITRHRRTTAINLTKELRGDLDWIVMKALEKDRNRRYETADSFAADIGRHLNHEPVVAGPPSAMYRLRKFARRNRLQVVAAILISSSLIVGIASTTGGLIWALYERDRADDNATVASANALRAQDSADIATAINDFLNQDLLSAVAPSTESGRGRDVLMRDVLDAAAMRLDTATSTTGRFAKQPVVEAAIRETLGNTYLELGEYAKAEFQLRKSVDVLHSLPADSGHDSIAVQSKLATLLLLTDRLNESEELAKRILGQARSTYGTHHTLTLAIMHNLGLIYRTQGRFDEALEEFERTRALQYDALGEEHVDTATTIADLGLTYLELGQFDQADELLRDALDLQRRVSGPEHVDTLTTTVNLAALLDTRGRNEEAEVLAKAVRESCERVFGQDHPLTLQLLGILANCTVSKREFESAEALYETLLGRQKSTLGSDHSDTAATITNLAIVNSMQGNYRKAEGYYEEANGILTRTLGPDHPVTLTLRYNLAITYALDGRLAEAETEHIYVLERRRQILGATNVITLMSVVKLGEVLTLQGKANETEFLWAGTIQSLADERGPLDGNTDYFRQMLADHYRKTGQPEQLRELMADYLDAYRAQIELHPANANLHNNLAWMLLTIDPETLRDPISALHEASLAADISDHRDPNILDTLACALFANERIPEAIDMQRRAISLLTTESQLRDEMSLRLAEYESALEDSTSDG